MVTVANSKITNAKTCLSAYKKKQEFGGATLNIKNSICKDSYNKIYVDKNSTVTIKN